MSCAPHVVPVKVSGGEGRHEDYCRTHAACHAPAWGALWCRGGRELPARPKGGVPARLTALGGSHLPPPALHSTLTKLHSKEQQPSQKCARTRSSIQLNRKCQSEQCQSMEWDGVIQVGETGTASKTSMSSPTAEHGADLPLPPLLQGLTSLCLPFCPWALRLAQGPDCSAELFLSDFSGSWFH